MREYAELSWRTLCKWAPVKIHVRRWQANVQPPKRTSNLYDADGRTRHAQICAEAGADVKRNTCKPNAAVEAAEQIIFTTKVQAAALHVRRSGQRITV